MWSFGIAQGDIFGSRTGNFALANGDHGLATLTTRKSDPPKASESIILLERVHRFESLTEPAVEKQLMVHPTEQHTSWT